MADPPEGVAHTIDYHHSEQQIPSRPKTSQRISSFSEALTKFKSNTFIRRRTNTDLPSSTSSVSINSHSRIPTPAGIDRSTSFFSTLPTFASNSNASTSEESPQPSLIKRPRKISERLAQTPFFSHQHQQQSALTPRNNRESSVKIEQRGLMQPVHPPLPRTNTIGSLGHSQQSSPLTPGFMRPTTSSARRSSGMGRSNTAAPSSMAGHDSVAMRRQRNTSLRTIAGSNTPSKTPTQARQVPADTFPAPSDSLSSAPSMTDEPVPTLEWETESKQPDMPIDYSDGANFQATGQHVQEVPIAKESKKGQGKASADHMHETRPAPPAKESKKGILKNENRILSEALSSLYVDDEPDTSKEERENKDIKTRSEQGTPEYERTATPESSNPRLVRIFPTRSYPLASSPRWCPLKASPSYFLPANVPPPPDPRSPAPHVVARPLHRPLRPLPHQCPPLASLLAL